MIRFLILRKLFLSTLSLRRATRSRPRRAGLTEISIHALLAESDKRRTYQRGERQAFLSTLSLRRATALIRYLINTYHHFYPRSPCGERRLNLPSKPIDKNISIHALLAESDTRRASRQHPAGISIHALLAESDGFGLARLVACANFYPRSPCGERPGRTCGDQEYQYFYPRSPCGERLRQNYECFKWIKFLSTLSLRRATANWFDLWGWAEYFYPRSPCGERLCIT